MAEQDQSTVQDPSAEIARRLDDKFGNRMDDASGEGFLARWSRRKHEAAAVAPVSPAAPEQTEPVPLPPVESLDIDSDFSAFMHGKVAEDLRRAALKRLFSSPQFNVMDGLDVYIDDYSIADPVPEAMLGQLAHARGMLFAESGDTGTDSFDCCGAEIIVDSDAAIQASPCPSDLSESAPKAGSNSADNRQGSPDENAS